MDLENLLTYYTDERQCNDNERQLLSLPIKLGEFGIINVIDWCKFHYETSKDVMNELTNWAVQQSDEPVDFANSKQRRFWDVKSSKGILKIY